MFPSVFTDGKTVFPEVFRRLTAGHPHAPLIRRRKKKAAAP
jgi:hypothetical protein